MSSAIKVKISFSPPLAQTAFPTQMWHSSRSECLSDRICQRVILVRVKIPYFLHVSAALWDESATAGDLCCPVFKACRLSAWICDSVLSRAQRGRVTSAHVPLYWTSTEWSLGSSPSFSEPELMWQDAVELGVGILEILRILYQLPSHPA